MKYVIVSDKEHIPEERLWYYDDFGQRRDKVTDDFVVLVNKSYPMEKQPLMTLTKVEGKWTPHQMELPFEEMD
tara:strand:- start:14294 stop:14512 length:219 start_codon:yes stop_codon:yes gene_type:complete